jgi:polysaccharide export outer membrane protein
MGCQSAAYRAEVLPAEFRAAATKSNQAINLAQITSPGTSNSILAPGDLLEITVATGRSEENARPIFSRVADDGAVDVPIIGPVHVAGMEEFEASQSIVKEAVQRGMYRHPYVTVQIRSKAVNRITVLGAVPKPGVHEIPRGGCDLVTAIAAAGGLKATASTDIEIIRQAKPAFAQQKADDLSPNPNAVQTASHQQLGDSEALLIGENVDLTARQSQVLQIDLANMDFADSSNYSLNDRDIVRVIQQKKKMIYVAGLVKRPGQFELPTDQDLHLVDAIALAGGRSSPVADKLLVIRHRGEQSEPLFIQASLSKAKKNGLENLRLAPGDTITVEQTPSTAVVSAFQKFFRVSMGFARSSIF